MRNYTTIQGDMWDGIAFKEYGDEKLMHKLIKANPEHRHTLIFSAGVTLSIPDVPKNSTAPLPPWRR